MTPEGKYSKPCLKLLAEWCRTHFKILKIHILSICMNILFFWTTHTHTRNTNTQDTWREPTNQSEWKKKKQLTCFLLYKRALKYCALKFSSHKLITLFYTLSQTFEFFLIHANTHSNCRSLSIRKSCDSEAMLCCRTLKWILDYKDFHRW